MSEKYFYFTIGPVQSFVAQARRTRDFWAGSFLLSWMAGVAMVAVEKQGGKITFPKPTGNYLDWIEGKGTGDKPEHGSIPNRFAALVPEDFNPDLVIEVVGGAWRALADSVWQGDVAKIADSGNATQEIWKRQIAGFWEISWAVADENDNSLLDRRKNWRNYFPKPELGTKCMVMDGWQEISGWEHSHKDEQKKQKYFWKAIRETNLQDFQENEKLCAIALVKRRFVRYFADFEYSAHGINLRGWKLSATRPSVAYLAAVHWIEKLLGHEDEQRVLEALRLFEEISTGHSEWNTRIRCLEAALENRPAVSRKDIALDGEVFFESSWQDENTYSDREAVGKLQKVLRALNIESPSPFYALLLMDGDSLGAHMSNPDNQPAIAEALDKFTAAVPEVVQRNNGVLVYAGGDDVLAILPLEDALKCAHELHSNYTESFRGKPVSGTISGAIAFAHFKTPLGAVLRDAHDLLDDVAKEECGRNAIAVRAWKPGGIAFTWAQPWEIALQNGAIAVEEIAADLRQNHDEDAKSTFSSKFLYKIREQFELLNPGKNEEALFTEDQITSLIAAEYLSSGAVDERNVTMESAKATIAPLLTQCRPHERDVETNRPVASSLLKMDGALLVRFLAYKGKDVR